MPISIFSSINSTVTKKLSIYAIPITESLNVANLAGVTNLTTNSIGTYLFVISSAGSVIRVTFSDKSYATTSYNTTNSNGFNWLIVTNTNVYVLGNFQNIDGDTNRFQCCYGSLTGSSLTMVYPNSPVWGPCGRGFYQGVFDNNDTLYLAHIYPSNAPPQSYWYSFGQMGAIVKDSGVYPVAPSTLNVLYSNYPGGIFNCIDPSYNYVYSLIYSGQYWNYVAKYSPSTNVSTALYTFSANSISSNYTNVILASNQFFYMPYQLNTFVSTDGNNNLCNYVLRINTTTGIISALGTGFTAVLQLYCMAYDNLRKILYVGGSFTSVGGITASYTAIWNENTVSWQTFVTLNGTCSSMAYSPSSNIVFMSGSFTTINGLSCNGFAAVNVKTVLATVPANVFFGLPSAITGLAVSSINYSGFTVTWSGGTGTSITNSFFINGIGFITPSSSGAGTATFTGLTYLTTWPISVTARNVSGCVNSSSLTVYPPPTAITGLAYVVGSVTTSGFSVTWSGGTSLLTVTTTYTINGSTVTPSSSGAGTASFTGLTGGPYWALIVTATNSSNFTTSSTLNVVGIVVTATSTGSYSSFTNMSSTIYQNCVCFSGSGTFYVDRNINVDIIMVGGGGGGGALYYNISSPYNGGTGGGGGGGEVKYGTLSLTAGVTYTINCGSGGLGATDNTSNFATNGDSTSFIGGGITEIALGGGHGTSPNNTTPTSGGSGGGAGGQEVASDLGNSVGANSGSYGTNSHGLTCLANNGGGGKKNFVNWGGGGGGGATSVGGTTNSYVLGSGGSGYLWAQSTTYRFGTGGCGGTVNVVGYSFNGKLGGNGAIVYYGFNTNNATTVNGSPAPYYIPAQTLYGWGGAGAGNRIINDGNQNYPCAGSNGASGSVWICTYIY